MSERSSEHLIEAALSLINDAISWQCAHQPVSKSLGDRRFDDVMHFIEMHFTDPNLSLTKAAKSLGISTRYLSLLLEHRGLHFSTLIWDKRLQAAKEWLPASAESGALVREIAYRVGFKSSAHFSRKFRKAFNMSPQNYRLLGGMALGSSLRVPVQPELARGH
jgi:AraC-like DNA-binding protein